MNLIHHPFIIKDRGPIVMNIKNSIPIPPKTAEQTKAILMQFPVSSGQHHRANESEWVPVEPAKPAKKDKEVPESTSTETTTVSKQKNAAVPQPVEEVPLPTTHYGYQTSIFTPPPEPLAICSAPISTQIPVLAPALTPAAAIEPAPSQSASDNIFAGSGLPMNAMRKLQENPMDSEAIKAMYKTQKDMSAWASSKFVPGQFTGSTGANILSTRELASGFQAWAKRSPQQAQNAKKAAKTTALAQAKQNFESKHPVSLLGELSAKRKFGPPLYELVMQEGPSHQRQFLYSVQINGQVYQPNVTSLNKKEAKANAAKFALQKMGFLPDVPAQTPQPQPMQVPQPIPPVQQVPPAQPYMAPPNQNPFSASNTFR